MLSIARCPHAIGKQWIPEQEIECEAISPCDAALNSMGARKRLFQPILAPMMADTSALVLILGAAIVQLGLTALGLPGWQCPIHTLFHITCPGCGLSTAAVLLLKGQWQASLGVHPFAVVFLACLIFMILVNILPRYLRLKALRWVGALERKTGVTVLLLFGLLGFWVVRLSRFAYLDL
jgi:hypothetical protein